LQQLRQLLARSEISPETIKNTICEPNFSIKIAELTIDRNFAMDYISERSDAHHFKASKWNDLKVTIHI
jgi:hypothetical protein